MAILAGKASLGSGPGRAPEPGVGWTGAGSRERGDGANPRVQICSLFLPHVHPPTPFLTLKTLSPPQARMRTQVSVLGTAGVWGVLEGPGPAPGYMGRGTWLPPCPELPQLSRPRERGAIYKGICRAGKTVPASVPPAGHGGISPQKGRHRGWWSWQLIPSLLGPGGPGRGFPSSMPLSCPAAPSSPSSVWPQLPNPIIHSLGCRTPYLGGEGLLPL